MDRATREADTTEVERVERETLLEVDPERAWEAISDPAMLERWLADEARIEPVEGAPVRFTVDGEERPGTVERVVEGSEIAFTWERRPGEQSLVELELEPCVAGTWVRVTETLFHGATAPRMMAAGAGWGSALARARSLFVLVAA